MITSEYLDWVFEGDFLLGMITSEYLGSDF